MPRRKCCAIKKKLSRCCLFIRFSFCLFDQMAEKYRLQDVLLAELSDVNLFCKLIKYPSTRCNMLKTFKVRVLLCKSADLDLHACGCFAAKRFAAEQNESRKNIS